MFTRNLSIRSPSSRLALAGFVTAALAAASAAVAAQGSQSHYVARGNDRSFQLSPQSYTQTLAYGEPRELRICNYTDRFSSAASDYDEQEGTPLTERPVPLTSPTPVDLRVNYDGATATVAPETCYRLRAERIELMPAERLSSTDVLVGSVTVSGPSDMATRDYADQAYRALATTLGREDELMRQSVTELSGARRDLLQASQALRMAQRQEAQVGDSEAHTRQVELEMQQRLGNQPGGG